MVFGDGSFDAKIFFTGEGPGADEQRQGIPFVGRSGKLLRKMIEAIGLNREDFYIANVVKDRPPDNRLPEPDEIEFCVKFLKKQIEIIEPKLIVLLGRTAVKGLLPEHKATPLDHLRDQSKELGAFKFNDIPIVVTFHPSALLRDPGRREKAKEDFRYIQNVFIGK
jgi:DNA polymerase